MEFVEIHSKHATVMHLHSESGDHYLEVFEGFVQNDEIEDRLEERFGEEAEYLDVEHIERLEFFNA